MELNFFGWIQLHPRGHMKKTVESKNRLNRGYLVLQKGMKIRIINHIKLKIAETEAVEIKECLYSETKLLVCAHIFVLARVQVQKFE